jgi:hypothetical protein
MRLSIGRSSYLIRQDALARCGIVSGSASANNLLMELSEGLMRIGFMHELRLARLQFVSLAMALLLLPQVLGMLPHPSTPVSLYIAALTGEIICSGDQIAGEDTGGNVPAHHGLCADCLAGCSVPATAGVLPVLLDALVPERRLANFAWLEGEREIRGAPGSENPARAPPVIL